MPDTPDRLAGRCGGCAYFHSVRLDAAKGVNVGECGYGTWPPVRPETSSCPAYVAIGTLAKAGPAKVKRAVQGRMRPDRPDDDDFEENERRARRERAAVAAAAAPGAATTAGAADSPSPSPASTAASAPTAPAVYRATGAALTPVAAPRRAPIEIEVDMDEATFRAVLREILSDELGLSEAPIGEKWKGGELVLKPGREGLQDKRIPIETFFHKIVMVRDKLRVLEQKINGSKQLSDEDKVTLQQYITGVYGTLTTFNVLFKDEKDKFVGASSD